MVKNAELKKGKGLFRVGVEVIFRKKKKVEGLGV